MCILSPRNKVNASTADTYTSTTEQTTQMRASRHLGNHSSTSTQVCKLCFPSVYRLFRQIPCLILTDAVNTKTSDMLVSDRKYVVQYGTTQRELAFLDLRQLQLLDTVCPMK